MGVSLRSRPFGILRLVGFPVIFRTHYNRANCVFEGERSAIYGLQSSQIRPCGHAGPPNPEAVVREISKSNLGRRVITSQLESAPLHCLRRDM